MYPRTVSVLRQASQTGVGYQTGYAGQTTATLTTVLTGLPASIQVRREGSQNRTGLPADATSPFWDIFLPRHAAVAGQIQTRDQVQDDLGRSFQVVAEEYEGLGYRLRCVLLEV